MKRMLTYHVDEDTGTVVLFWSDGSVTRVSTVDVSIPLQP